MYIDNPFEVGQCVICIKDDFHFIPKFGGIEGSRPNTPKKDEILTVDEVLGEFLRFEKYDEFHSYNWWFHQYFKPLSLEKEKEITKKVESLISVGN